MSIAASTVVLPSGGERRLVDRRREPAAQRSLVVDDGCDVRAGYRSLDHATRVTLLTWLPLTRGELAILENGLLVQAPPDAVSLLLRPPTIWSLADALSLQAGRRPEAASRHVRRVRAGARRIEAQLPFAGLPRASATVAAGCRALDRDAAACADAAVRQLARFAASDLVRGP